MQIHLIAIQSPSWGRNSTKTPFWKSESARNPISKELASEDPSIESYGDFEPDRSAVGRLRRRAFSGKKGPKPVFYVQKKGQKNENKRRQEQKNNN